MSWLFLLINLHETLSCGLDSSKAETHIDMMGFRGNHIEELIQYNNAYIFIDELLTLSDNA